VFNALGGAGKDLHACPWAARVSVGLLVPAPLGSVLVSLIAALAVELVSAIMLLRRYDCPFLSML